MHKILLLICLLFFSCKEKSAPKEKFELPLKENSEFYYADQEQSIELKKYNFFTNINASCATCFMKLDMLNKYHDQLKDKNDVGFYVVAYSDDHFELLKYLLEEKRIPKLNYTLILHKGNLNENQKALMVLNRTTLVAKDSTVLYFGNIVDEKENLSHFLKFVK